MKGCPSALRVIQADSANKTNIEDVLHNNCDEAGKGWIAPESAVDEAAELVIHLGCPQKITSVQIKNLKKEFGGTKSFTLYIGNHLSGPWNLVKSGELNQTEDCTDPMQVIKLQKG